MVLLEDQDRDRWDHAAITEASTILSGSLRVGAAGPYLIQAAIACVHGQAETYGDTDWEEIASLYRVLEGMVPTAVVTVNRAVAEAMAHGPETGLALLDGVEGIEGWHLYWTTRADLLRRAGRLDEAIGAYKIALNCPMNEPDRRLVAGRLEGMSRGGLGSSRPTVGPP